MGSNHWILLPFPRHITPNQASFDLKDQTLICFQAGQSEFFLPAARKLQQAIAGRFGLHWKMYYQDDISQDRQRINFRFNPDDVTHPQGYRLQIGQGGIFVECQDAAGSYYAVCTLIQILSQIPVDCPVLPGVEIEDWPDFPARGVMLDISRDKVYQLETLYELIDRLSSWKINQLQLYTEHTFAYQKHPDVWQHASPMTAEEIRQLDAYCKDRFIELVPNQNSFGHMERWLKHEKYAHLAETLDEYTTQWGELKQGPYGLSPVEPGSLALLASLYDELLPNFPSSNFNVGCDETIDLGKGRSKSACERLGDGQVYLDFLLKIYQLVSQRGKRMQFWGDIILKHPDCLDQMPRDVIGLIWGYEANHPFEQQAAKFAASGLQFYVCPGNSVWNSLAGRTDNTLGNLHNAAIQGLKYGAIGYLITDWGDNGHWQSWPISFLGLVVGAGLSWCVAENMNPPVHAWLNHYVFEDIHEVMGNLAYDLGNSDHAEGTLLPGNGGYFWPLQLSVEQIRNHKRYQPEMFLNGLKRINEIEGLYWGRDRMKRSDSHLIRREFALTICMMRHACRRALFAFGKGDGSGLAKNLSDIMAEYRQVWLLRNRPGGLEDSLARLEKLYTDYP